MAGDAKGFEDEQSNWSVSDPITLEDTSGLIKIGNVVKYMVTGQTSEGRFEVQRRYNEFLALNRQLNNRWPGMYVPAIPEKQLIGDKESGFIEERRQLLERFIRECAKYDYLIESKEFKIFTQTTQGEVTKQLEDLPKLGPAQILEKYKIEFNKINLQDYDKTEIATLRERVSIFRQFLAKCQASNTQSRNAMMNCVKEHA